MADLALVPTSPTPAPKPYVTSDAVDSLTFRRYLRRLRKTCPVMGPGGKKPVKVSVIRVADLRAEHEELFGYTTFRDNGDILIQIADGPRSQLVDTLIHEWAHALSGTPLHNAKWGAAYARVYRAFCDCE